MKDRELLEAAAKAAGVEFNDKRSPTELTRRAIVRAAAEIGRGMK